jgi:VanZ family protein
MPRRLLLASRALLVVTAAAVTWLSLVPSPPDAVSGPDKLAHLLAYATLGVLAGLSFAPKLTGVSAAIAVVVGLAAYGAVVEGAQQLTGRELDVSDMIANAAGAAVGVAIAFLVRRAFGRRGVGPDRHR